MPRVIVERTFDTPLTQKELDAVEKRMAPCLDLYNVRWIRSYWSADRRRMICEYDARMSQAYATSSARPRRSSTKPGLRTCWSARPNNWPDSGRHSMLLVRAAVSAYATHCVATIGRGYGEIQAQGEIQGPSRNPRPSQNRSLSRGSSARSRGARPPRLRVSMPTMPSFRSSIATIRRASHVNCKARATSPLISRMSADAT